MTPACTTLKRLGIAYSEHIYQHDPHVSSYGLEAAEKLGLAPHAVFKTLLVSDDKQLMVAIVPVTHQLSLKKWPTLAGSKKSGWRGPMKPNAAAVIWLAGLAR